MNGVAALMRRYSHGTISRHDLVRAWSQSSGKDLRPWAKTLIPAPQPEDSEAD
jgi:hypothetical protein